MESPSSSRGINSCNEFRPTIDLAVGYSGANSSPILQLFLSRLGELRANTPAQKQ